MLLCMYSKSFICDSLHISGKRRKKPSRVRGDESAVQEEGSDLSDDEPSAGMMDSFKYSF